MAAEDLKHKLTLLEKDLSDLKSELKRLKEEARKISEERRDVKSKMRELRLEALKFRDARNGLNEEVKNLKVVSEELRREYSEKLDLLKELRRKIRKSLKMRPSRSQESLEREIAEIDWRIQTEPLPLDEEEKLVKQVKSLEEQLAFYRRLNEMENEAAMLEKSLKEIKCKVNVYRNKIAETAAKSQKFHEKMIECFKKVEAFKSEVDKVNKIYAENRAKTEALRFRYKELLNQISSLKRIIQENEELRRKEAISTLKEKIGREALEKLKRGEKISFEEFKILAEQGKI